MGDWKDMTGYEKVYESAEGVADPVAIFLCRYPETVVALALPENAKEAQLFDELGKKLETVATEQRKRVGPDLALAHRAFEMVSGREGYGSKGKSGVKIFVLRPPELEKLIEGMDDDHKKSEGKLTPREIERCTYLRVAGEIERLAAVQAARLDPKTEESRRKTKTDFEKAFIDAGLLPTVMEAIENKYWPDGIPEMKVGDPWYLVTTPIGVIEIGWRKRVININWHRLVVKTLTEEQQARFSGDALFKFATDAGETSTAGDHYVHAYGYEKAAAYLKVIAEAAAKAQAP